MRIIIWAVLAITTECFPSDLLPVFFIHDAVWKLNRKRKVVESVRNLSWRQNVTCTLQRILDVQKCHILHKDEVCC